jgi:hypothetical protein
MKSILLPIYQLSLIVFYRRFGRFVIRLPASDTEKPAGSGTGGAEPYTLVI